MATQGAGHGRPVVMIAPAPAVDPSAREAAPPPPMPYTCQTCARRKVKCDKATPICSTCRRCRLECVYLAPAPRARKRKPVDLESDVLETLARYEDILRHHGLLGSSELASADELEEPMEDPIFPLWNGPSNKPWVGMAGSSYINSHVWRNIGDEVENVANSDEDEAEGISDLGLNEELTTTLALDEHALDPLSGSFLSPSVCQSLLQYHPSRSAAITLWNTHVENVEPLCKVLHIPSTAHMVDLVSQQPSLASKADECLLFAVYHFAVLSMTEEDCAHNLGYSRGTLLSKYNFATRQALINARFLKTIAMPVLQALVLLLLACKHTYDPHTYWILTGVASRIALRMGIHRDGEKLNLQPFDVQMRRRLFYQILPLEGTASRMCGMAVSMPNFWDAKLPLNINDDQIWPGMDEAPKEQRGATEMIFCLSRSDLGTMLVKTGKNTALDALDAEKSEMAIQKAESEIEEKYVRYCDIASPLHVLTMGSARAGIAAMRLRARLVKVKNGTASDDERIDLFRLARKILDTDTATRACAGLSRFQWHTRSFFLWGMWDSIIYILMVLLKHAHLFTALEIAAAWNTLEQTCENHDEMIAPNHALYVACGRLMLKAWGSRGAGTPEPGFIAALRGRHESGIPMKQRKMKQKVKASSSAVKDGLESEPARDGLGEIATPPLSGFSGSPGPSAMIDFDFDFDETDWSAWGQLLEGPLPA